MYLRCALGANQVEHQNSALLVIPITVSDRPDTLQDHQSAAQL